MRPFSARAALAAWERGQRADPVGRAQALLAAALPGQSRERLQDLTIGQRDALLMRVRERTFGGEIKGLVICPRCGTKLEFPLDLRRYDVAGTLARPLAASTFSCDGFQIRFHVPTAGDLAAAAHCADVESARRLLLERCVEAVERGGQVVPPSALPEPVVEQLGKRMEDLDPLAYLPLAVDCVRCLHHWLVLLDIAVLLWQEIASAAERLLRDVQTLALAYGWSEAEILGMSEARRKFYIEQIPTSPAPPTPRTRRA